MEHQKQGVTQIDKKGYQAQFTGLVYIESRYPRSDRGCNGRGWFAKVRKVEL